MDCTVYSGHVPVVPWHPYTRASQAPLGTSPTEVKVEVFPTSVAFQPGHRLRIALTTADLPAPGTQPLDAWPTPPVVSPLCTSMPRTHRACTSAPTGRGRR